MKKIWIIVLVILVVSLCSICCSACVFLTTGLVVNSKSAQVQPAEAVIKPTLPVAANVTRERVILLTGNQLEYFKLVEAAAASGINITVISDREEFLSEIIKPDVALVIYPADGWNRADDLQQIRHFVDAGGRVLFVYHQGWTTLSGTFEDMFGVSIYKEDVINTGSQYELAGTLPSLLSDFDTYTQGSMWVLGSAYLETDISGGQERYLPSRFNDEDRLVFFSAPDKSATFLLSVRSNEPYSFVFFDDTGIQYGENREAALELLKYLLE